MPRVPATLPITGQEITIAVWGAYYNIDILSSFAYARANYPTYFDPAYDNNTYAPANSALRFRNYGPPSVSLPILTTTVPYSISSSSAYSGGNISSDGGGAITARGVCWATSHNPIVTYDHTTDGTGTGTFISLLGSLTNNIPYYVRAYATNSAGTAYGQEEKFITTAVVNSGYGKLYNQYAVNDYRGIAAPGWHVPTRTELDQLITNTGGVNVAGGRLKLTGTTHWKTPNTGATNQYGFNAAGAGIRDASVEGYIQEWGEFWASNSGAVMVITYNSGGAYTGLNVPRTRGCSVRLIKDGVNPSLSNYTGNDGTTYSSVKIGTQVWMAESLTETLYADFTGIPNVQNYSDWNGLTTGAMCWYNNNPAYE